MSSLIASRRDFVSVHNDVLRDVLRHTVGSINPHGVHRACFDQLLSEYQVVDQQGCNGGST
jgi:hypothetical protein